MGITVEHTTIPGSPLGSENPFPQFHGTRVVAPVHHDETFLPEDLSGFGTDLSFRALPYRMQETYSRRHQQMPITTIVLENEHLKATFFPEYGARLASLVEKASGREYLFANPVFQPANLAIRNAWFSGGVEWNIGRFGHTVFTCAPVFFGRVVGEDGEEFLRAWEFERTTRLYYSIDFHLPADSRELDAHVRIMNRSSQPAPAYWWTNTAVREEKNLRIFSGTDQVIYIKPESNKEEGRLHTFGRAAMPYLPSLPGKDASYPQNFTYSSEYFFQTHREETSPWEGAGYDDGFLFFERSTPRLRYRKMFCWGTHPGGRHWCDYLSLPGAGDYVEIQAGLSPSQVHITEIPAGTTWDFTQSFGGTIVDSGVISGPWSEANEAVHRVVDERVPPGEITDRHRRYQAGATIAPREILHHGSGWGALENLRRGGGRETSQAASADGMLGGLLFPEETLGREQEPWVALLTTGTLPEPSGNPSYMVDPAWKPILQRAAERDPPPPVGAHSSGSAPGGRG